MPTVRRTRELRASPEDVWTVLADPHHLPRWWPRVQRVESVDADQWTAVLATERGKPVRADFRVVESEEPRRRVWEQELADSPFERLLAEAVTAATLEPGGDGTRVTLEVRQRLRGLNRLGSFFVKRATRAQVDEALAGLEAACAR